MSTLSTTAIKDGHQGHPQHHGHAHHLSTGSASSTTTLDAERADRISRLAGLERVSTARPTSFTSHLNPSSSVGGTPQPPGYFDNTTPQIRERSTVGSASATGSVGGRTTWASGSDVYEADKMSEDQDDGISSTGGFSDEGNASLVGFGEGAGSTVSGPVSTPTTRAAAVRQNSVGRPSSVHMQDQGGSPMSGIVSGSPAGSVTPDPRDARMMDGMTYDADVVDTSAHSPVPTHGRNLRSSGADMAERIMRDRLNEGEAGRKPLGSPGGQGQGLGKFSFEDK